MVEEVQRVDCKFFSKGRKGSEEEEEEAARSWVDFGDTGKIVLFVDYVWTKYGGG